MSADDLEQAAIKVLRHQHAQAVKALEVAAATAAIADALLKEASEILRSVGESPGPAILGSRASPWVTPDRARILRDWEAIHQDAVDFDPSRAAIADILPAEEIDRVLTQLGLVGAEYDDAAHPDVYDYVGSALAVTLAGIAGFFLVNVPRHRGLLGADGVECPQLLCQGL
jgi:hypothetical protein